MMEAISYKAKCATCHGADVTGKPAAKIPSLLSDDDKKASDDDLAKSVAEKAKHPPTVKSLPADQVKMVVESGASAPRHRHKPAGL